MNKIKVIKTTTNIERLQFININLQVIYNNLDKISIFKKEADKPYKLEQDQQYRRVKLFDAIFKTNLFSVDHSNEQNQPKILNQLHYYLNSLNETCFELLNNGINNNISDNSINNNTINEYRFSNFNFEIPNSDHWGMELNAHGISYFCQTKTVANLQLQLENLTDFMDKKIWTYVSDLPINSYNTTKPLITLTGENAGNNLEQIWDFYLNNYIESIKNFILIHQTKYQQGIKTLKKYQIEVKNGNEFLLSQPTRLLMNNTISSYFSLINKQQQQMGHYLTLKDIFINDLKIKRNINNNKITLQPLEAKVQEIINNQLCIINNNNLAITEQFKNIKWNMLNNCPENFPAKMTNGMNKKLIILTKYLHIYNNDIANKLQNARDFIPGQAFNVFNFTVNNKKLKHELVINIMEEILNEFKYYKDELLITTILPLEQFKNAIAVWQNRPGLFANFDNPIDINILPQNNIKQRDIIIDKVLTVKTDYNQTAFFNNQWEQIKKLKINDLLLESEYNELTTLIVTNINELENIISEEEKKLLATNDDIKIPALTIETFIDKFKHLLLNSEKIIDHAIKRWFKNYLLIINNKYAPIFMEETLQYVVLKQHIFTILRNLLLEQKHNFMKNANYPLNDLLLLEKFNMISLKEVQIISKDYEKNIISFMKKYLKIEKHQLALSEPTNNFAPNFNYDLFFNSAWQINKGCFNFCQERNERLPQPFLVIFMSKKTKILISQWKKIISQNLIMFMVIIANYL